MHVLHGTRRSTKGRTTGRSFLFCLLHIRCYLLSSIYYRICVCCLACLCPLWSFAASVWSFGLLGPAVLLIEQARLSSPSHRSFLVPRPLPIAPSISTQFFYLPSSPISSYPPSSLSLPSSILSSFLLSSFSSSLPFFILLSCFLINITHRTLPITLSSFTIDILCIS